MAYLRNCWYVAATSAEIDGTLLRRKLLDEPVVLYRTTAGVPAALRDSCPHRFAPLSKGVVVGDTLQCGYHGLRFATDGRCTLNPHAGGATPRSLDTRGYPVAERHGYIWFWPGDVAAANPDLLPSTIDFLSDSEHYATVRGYLRVKANYQLIIDNLLDLTHIQFVHPQFGVSTMDASQALKANTAELVRDGDRVCAKRMRANSPPSDYNRKTFGITEELVDSRADMYWQPPSLIYFDLGLTKPGDAQSSLLALPAAHMITPETELTSHYFYAQGRDARIHDEHLSREHLAFTEYAFREQDEPMLEAQQENMGISDLMVLKPAMLQIDSGPVAARRVLEKLIAAEQVEN